MATAMRSASGKPVLCASVCHWKCSRTSADLIDSDAARFPMLWNLFASQPERNALGLACSTSISVPTSESRRQWGAAWPEYRSCPAGGGKGVLSKRERSTPGHAGRQFRSHGCVRPASALSPPRPTPAFLRCPPGMFVAFVAVAAKLVAGHVTYALRRNAVRLLLARESGLLAIGWPWIGPGAGCARLLVMGVLCVFGGLTASMFRAAFGVLIAPSRPGRGNVSPVAPALVGCRHGLHPR